MSEGHARSQVSPTPRTAAPVFPPLSKFYCGPAQGWHSAEVSPHQDDTAWRSLASTPDLNTSLPPRMSPAPTVPSPGHWQNHLGRAYEDLQGWQNPLPQIPTVRHERIVEHRENTINPGWDSRPNSSAIDDSTWEAEHYQRNAQTEDSISRLKPMPHSVNDEGTLTTSDRAGKRISPSSKYSSQQYSTRASATTIDVPLFLQPQPYDPETAPPMPESPMINHRNQQLQRQSSQREKAFSHTRNVSRDNLIHNFKDIRGLSRRSSAHAHRQHDSRGSYSSVSSKMRPNLKEELLVTNEVQPASRPRSRDDTTALDSGAPRTGSIYHDNNAQHDLYPSEQSKMQTNWTDATMRRSHGNISRHQWDPVPASIVNSELQQGYNYQQERRSTTATDVSSNLPATSTPDSHETSNTSYKGSEQLRDIGNPDEESNDSFYWHSGRSSSEGEDDEGAQLPKASRRTSHRNSTFDHRSDHDSTSTARGNSAAAMTASTSKSVGDQGEAHVPGSTIPYEPRQGVLPTRSSSLSPNPTISYSASALGFGGPSDWEYFGDYEAEEVDDEDLYVHKPRAELPAGQGRVAAPTVAPPEPPLPPLSESGASMNAEGFQTETLDSLDQQVRPEEPFETTRSEDHTGPGSKWSPSTTTPTTPHGNSSRPITVTSEPLPGEDHRTDLEEVIRAWSHSPYVGRTSSMKSYKNGLSRSSENYGHAGEASLASTPGDNVFGIHAFPKDAPPLPKLPPTVDLDSMTNPASGHDDDRQEVEPHRDFSNDQQGNLTAPDSDNIREQTAVIAASNAQPASQPLLPDHSPDTADPIAGKAQVNASAPFASMASNVENPGEISTTPDPVSREEPAEKKPDEDRLAQPLLKIASKGQPPPASGRIETARIAAPLSEFARKRQLFETAVDPKPPPGIIPRKPLRTLKQSPSEVSLTGDKKFVPSVASEHSLANRSQPTSSGGSLQSIGAEPPFVSRVGNTEALQNPRQEDLVLKTVASLENVQSESPAPIPSSIVAPTSEPVSIPTSTRTFENTSPPTAISIPAYTAASVSEAVVIRPSAPSPPPVTASTQESAPEAAAVEASHSELGSVLESDSTPASALVPTEAPQSSQSHTEGMTDAQETPTRDLVRLEPEETFLSQSLPLPHPVETHFHQQSDGKPPLPVTSAPSTDSGKPLQISVSSTEPSDKDATLQVDTPSAIEKKYISESSSGVLAADENKSDTGTDPYADLDPWGRASLNRFAAMLREEARAESNKDKLNIFNVFTTRETRLRVVLYGTDEELILTSKYSKLTKSASQRDPSQKLQHLAKASSVKVSARKPISGRAKQGASKELPPLPPDRDSIIGSPAKTSGLDFAQGDGSRAAAPLATTAVISHRNLQDGSVMMQDVNDTNGNDRLGADFLQAPADEKGIAKEPSTAGVSIANVDPAANTAIESSGQTRPRPKGDGEVQNYLTNRRSIYRPFATQTAESMENASNFGREIDFAALPPPVPPLPALEQTPSAGDHPSQDATNGDNDAETDQDLDLRRFDESDFDPLIIVLPPNDVTHHESPDLADLKAILDSVPDDFGFIHEGVVSWDGRVKLRREDNERARHARQMESEQRIDALFDDHEIGYGDIAELEGDFKRSEATRKAQEDRWEYDSFVNDVFDLVWARLTYEIDQLRPHYEHYSKLMDQTVAGKDMFTVEKSLALAPTMSAFLGLHQKLEIRYQKAFEAVLERDRRLKKVEMSPWHGLSNLEKLRQLDKQFEDAEKRSIIDYCLQRDERANRLMDVLDQNTLRGVGANQDYMEAIMKGVRRIAGGRAFASLPSSGNMQPGIKLVERAMTTVASLASSSEQIVQTFHVADMLLNNADYEVSVAKAKVAKDMGALSRLKEERAKEDQKLMRDLEHRLALIREDHRRTHDEIIKLMLFLGVHHGTITEQPVPAALGTQYARSAGEAMHADVSAGAQPASNSDNQDGRLAEEDDRQVIT